MSFRSYIESHYVEAHAEHRNVKWDRQILAMLGARTRDARVVKTWMQAYELVRGINGEDRDKAANCFLDFAATHQRLHSPLSNDAFVHSTLTVMQCIDGDLSGFEAKIGRPPAPGDTTEAKNSYPVNAKGHYMAYQSMVRKLCSSHAGLLAELKAHKADELRLADWSIKHEIHSDIRIIDKLLWMIGDPTDLHPKSKQA